jgi:hypothetical protein
VDELSRSFFIRVARSGAQRSSLISLAQLATRATTLQRLLVRTQTSATVDRQDTLDFGMWPRDHVHADQLTNAPGRSRARVSRRFDRTNVAAHKDRHVAGADVLLPEQLYIRCFDHGIGGLNCTHESFGLNHSECFQGHLFVLTFIYCRY